MTEPSQYFKGRTVQEQMDEVIGYVDTRAAEVATTAIASDVAQVHQDMLDADADAQAAAASAAAAAGTLTNAVKKTGEASQSIAGDIAVAGTLSGGVVTGTQVTVPAPVNNTDAATKKYVDDQDALQVSIADINQYAVGLTGNQTSILGIKAFNSLLGTMPQKKTSSTVCMEVCKVSTSPSTSFNVNLLAATRYSADIIHALITTDADGEVTSISVSAISTATKTSFVGAFVEDGKLIITVRPSGSNMNVSAAILNISMSSGIAVANFDYSGNTTARTISTISNYVEEA